MYDGKTAILVALILAASGCMSTTETTTTTMASTGDKEMDAATTTTLAEEGATETTLKARTTTTVKAQTGLGQKLNNLGAAMSAGVSYKCTYTYNNIKTESWMKGSKFNSISTINGVQSHALSDGIWMYLWEEGNTEGMKFNINQMKSMGQTKSQGYQDMNQVASSATSVDCVPDLSADGNFLPPANVKFQDMGELLKQMKELQGQGGMPGKGGLPSGLQDLPRGIGDGD